MPRFVFITGGVVSSLGKGLGAAGLGKRAGFLEQDGAVDLLRLQTD